MNFIFHATFYKILCIFVFSERIFYFFFTLQRFLKNEMP